MEAQKFEAVPLHHGTGNKDAGQHSVHACESATNQAWIQFFNLEDIVSNEVITLNPNA